ncbi:single-stranded DNA-binding protein [Thermomonospora umbrina]|uniref:single-stranded DNA-binding protein n=1 Tax=Thermomonospora umbrina TaxID=111806 RepID=UPI000E27056E|nr:single-stranded DNA-binding protein [Thermomonospora umbrina]
MKSPASTTNPRRPAWTPYQHRPDLRELAAVGIQGVAVAGFTVAASRRVFDKTEGQWADGGTLFLRCSAFRQLAENVMESLSRGSRVVVTGRLRQRSYEGRDGVQRTVFEVDVEDVGPSLKWATANITRTRRDRTPQSPTPRDDDPWAIDAAPASAAPAPQHDSVPF